MPSVTKHQRVIIDFLEQILSDGDPVNLLALRFAGQEAGKLIDSELDLIAAREHARAFTGSAS